MLDWKEVIKGGLRKMAKKKKKRIGISFHTLEIKKPQWVMGYKISDEALGTIEGVYRHVYVIIEGRKA